MQLSWKTAVGAVIAIVAASATWGLTGPSTAAVAPVAESVTVSYECDDGSGLIGFRATAPSDATDPVSYKLVIDGNNDDAVYVQVNPGETSQFAWDFGYEDGTYNAVVTSGQRVVTDENITVNCNPDPTAYVQDACAGAIMVTAGFLADDASYAPEEYRFRVIADGPSGTIELDNFVLGGEGSDYYEKEFAPGDDFPNEDTTITVTASGPGDDFPTELATGNYTVECTEVEDPETPEVIAIPTVSPPTAAALPDTGA